MALTTGQKNAVTAALMRCSSQYFQEIPNLSKSDLYDAVEAADTYQDSIAGAYNSALPVAARTNLSAAQKSLVFQAVAAADYLLADPEAAQVFQCIASELVAHVS